MFKLFKRMKVVEPQPYPRVAENSELGVKVERVAYRTFYDSEWKVTTPTFSKIITRWDGETSKNLLKIIEDLPSLTEEEIEKLDERDVLYYD